MRKAIPWVLAALLVGALFVIHRGNASDAQQLLNAAAKLKQQAAVIAQLDVSVGRLQHTRDSLQKAQTRIDTLYLKQRQTFAQSDSAYHAAPLTTVHDTVWVPKAVADEAVKACSLVLLTCDQRAALAERRVVVSDSIAQDLLGQRDAAYQQRDASTTIAAGIARDARKSRWSWGLSGFGAGAVSCSVLSLLHR